MAVAVPGRRPVSHDLFVNAGVEDSSGCFSLGTVQSSRII